eukprot:TRINITY_DN90052_c0_g1_i1.p1 TRINITY_DN90052_c0_g1~~TRINITY_DN90052_c0_g1_i1.p1  ORF type:complete len:479 (+),score=127.62 TRINITY_DN90052_c0_g1_i1:66-1502(+)
MMKKVKAEQARATVKKELHAKVSAPVKSERMAVKAEKGVAQSSTVKKEAGSVKAEPGLPPLKAKVEQLRKVKAELGGAGAMANLLARGLELRKASEQRKAAVKREKGKRGEKLVKVKKERSRNKDGTLRKKPRVTAKMRKSRREVMNREVALSDELGELLGEAALSRPEAVKKLWMYCRERGMLNPSNRREIQFNPELEQMMGKSTATMPELIGLLTPHFDYSRSVDEVKKEVKTKMEMKQELKKEKKEEEQEEKVKREHKFQKGSTGADIKATKNEKRAKLEPINLQKKMKLEPTLEGTKAQLVVDDALSASLPRVLRFDRTSVSVQCVVPCSCTSCEAVATPTSGGGEALRSACRVELQEGSDGFVESYAQADIVKLDPNIAYRIFIETSQPEKACSCEALLPQRALPAKWSQREVSVWSMTQQVPELARMVKDYGVDGTTLLSLVEEDLRHMGVAAPFLLQRLMKGIEQLRAGGC